MKPRSSRSRKYFRPSPSPSGWWTRKRENLFFAASTSLLPAAGRELATAKGRGLAIIRAMQEHAEPKDIETSKEALGRRAPALSSHPVPHRGRPGLRAHDSRRAVDGSDHFGRPRWRHFLFPPGF